MPYYEYYRPPLGPPLPPFVTKRLPKYGSQYIPLHSSRYTLARNIPAHEQEVPTRWYSAPGVTRYQPRRGPVRPDPQAAKYHKLNATKSPAYYKPNATKSPAYYKPNATKSPAYYKPNATKGSTKPRVPDLYQHPLGTQYPYDGMTKGPHGAIHKGSAPCVSEIPLPRVTKGPVMYPTKSPSTEKVPLPRVTKGPILYASDDPLLYGPKDTRVTKGPLPRMSKGPILHSTKSPQPFPSHDSQLNVMKDPRLHGSKGTLPRKSKGPRFLATKVPRFCGLKPSRSFLRKGSRPNLAKDSQASLMKGSRPSLTKSSRVSLAKGSQPSLTHPAAHPTPKKLPKNVKISSTGKKYCSATKWPF